MSPRIARAAALATCLLSAVPSIAAEGTADKRLGPGALAPPPREGGISLVDALWKRRSVRKFADRPVAREQLGFVLWAAAGVNRPEEKRRTVPSAWGANTVSVYVTSADGTLVYDPLEHALRAVEAAKDKDLREKVAGAEFTRKAPVVLILVADLRKSAERGAADMRLDMARADAGAISQNIYLAAAALDLGTVVTADVRPETGALLGLQADEKPLFTLPLGLPAEAPAGAAGKGEAKR